MYNFANLIMPYEFNISIFVFYFHNSTIAQVVHRKPQKMGYELKKKMILWWHDTIRRNCYLKKTDPDARSNFWFYKAESIELSLRKVSIRKV
jgi:hypothetical protein